MIYWVYLCSAIVCEVAGTVCMKLSDGFQRPFYGVLMGVFYVVSFTFLTYAVKKIDISIAYAIWAGLGTALITAVGIFWFKEGAGVIKLLCVALIIMGVLGLKLTSKG